MSRIQISNMFLLTKLCTVTWIHGVWTTIIRWQRRWRRTVLPLQGFLLHNHPSVWFDNSQNWSWTCETVCCDYYCCCQDYFLQLHFTCPSVHTLHWNKKKNTVKWIISFKSLFLFFLELDWRSPTGSVIKAGNQTDYTELLLLLLLSDSAENICFPSPLPCYQGSFSRYVLVLRSKKWLYGCYTLIVTFVQILIKWLPCNHLLS